MGAERTGSLSGLTESEAKEFHGIFMTSFIVFTVIGKLHGGLCRRPHPPDVVEVVDADDELHQLAPWPGHDRELRSSVDGGHGLGSGVVVEVVALVLLMMVSTIWMSIYQS